MCKLVPVVCQAILDEFQKEYLTCLAKPEDWKKIEETFNTKWNVPQALGALDGKHIAMKKPKKYFSEYYNYMGFFFLVLIALVDADNRFLWVDVESSGSVSDAQMFNCSKLRKKSRMAPWGFCHLNHWGREDQICTIFAGW